MRKFGLIGKNISYSFSQGYFTEKFQNENIQDAEYTNFDLQDISEFQDIIATNKQLAGMNVTIPYKETVIPFLHKMSKKAKNIGAVNTIRITKKGYLKGYNTDCYGFKKSLEPIINDTHKKALILGTGGASKAVAYTLKELGIDYQYVSRTASGNNLSYTEVTPEIIKEHLLIINCTPLGTFPNVKNCPDINYKSITSKHVLYDLIYNPEETEFLKRGRLKKATTKNGLDMLKFQAEKAWTIWNK